MKKLKLNEGAKFIVWTIFVVVGIALFTIAFFTYLDFMGEYMGWLLENQQFIKK